MVWLTLTILIAAQSQTASPTPSMGPRTTLSAEQDFAVPGVSTSVIQPSVPTCSEPLQRVSGRYEPAPAEEGRVKLYHTFALQVGSGCPIPVIAREVVPEADRAIGRVLGRDLGRENR